MEDHLMEQMVNELRALLKQMNDKYSEFYHFNLLTIVNLKEESCAVCVEKDKQCLRGVVGYACEEKKEEAVKE